MQDVVSYETATQPGSSLGADITRKLLTIIMLMIKLP